MEGTMYRRSNNYGKRQTAKYAEYYEAEPTTLKGVMKKTHDTLKARYTLIRNRKMRQRHHTKQIREQLRSVGLTGLDLIKPETFYISTIVKPNEKIIAAICGHIENGSSVLFVITNSRFLYLNIVPFFTTIEEIGFGIIEAVRLDIGQFEASVHLYTRIENFTITGANVEAAAKFVEKVEAIVEAN